MSSRHSRFVTVCQQLLVLGVICAALTPAATLINLDIVPDGGGGQAGRAPGPAGTAGAGAPASMAAYVRATRKPSLVPTAAVDPKVKEFALTAPPGARVAPKLLAARKVAPYKHGGQRILSEPKHVKGYGAVGVTWEHGDLVSERDIKVKVRTKKHGVWSGWQKVAYHDDHGPDVGSAEARNARPGTDEMLVGHVAKVQVKIASKQTLPPDMKLAVINPGHAKHEKMERPALDTNTMGGDDAAPAVVPAAVQRAATGATGGTVDATLAAAAYTPKPVIYSRAQWGADERMREKSSLHYYEVHAGFVHHTATANGYTAAQVPAIIRSIYAYHTKSKGWSDIGYNFLVDRFGRIWEGRYGGVQRAVVGAHTLGYNDNAFAASAIGNYEEVQPSKAMIEAYGALFGWKLSLFGVSATSTRQYVTSRYFQAINGHRDAGQTACPGKYLYAKLPEIRKLAAAAQVGWAGRQLESNITQTAQPDLIVRRASDKQGFVIPIRKQADGTFKTGKPVATGIDLTDATKIFDAGDWDRDGHADLIYRTAAGDLYLARGIGNGKFAAPTLLAHGFASVGLLSAVGDMTGDGWPDLMGQPQGGDMQIYPGYGLRGIRQHYVAYSHVTAQRQIGAGRWDADGAPDVLFRNGPDLAWMRGNGPGGLSGSATKLPIDLKPYDWTIGVSDVNLTGHPDLVLRSKGTGRLWLVQATVNAFATPVLIGSGMQVYDMAAE